MIRSLLPVLVLLLLALLSTIYLFSLEANLRPDAQGEARAPKLIGNGLRTTLMSENGQPARRLVAARAVEGPGATGTDMVGPRLLLYDRGEPATAARSRTGWLSSDYQLLLLLSSVEIVNFPGPERTEGRLTTEYLEVYPETKQATTDRPVRISSPGHVVDAVGMRADLEQNIIELLSKVRGQHDLNHN
jgi:lipopolysaccharide export system protein LptC